jgi:hypothetical protein
MYRVLRCLIAFLAADQPPGDNMFVVYRLGLVREISYDPKASLSSLVTGYASLASLRQRAGRAGEGSSPPSPGLRVVIEELAHG